MGLLVVATTTSRPIRLVIDDVAERLLVMCDVVALANFNRCSDMRPVHTAFMQLIEDNQSEDGDVPVVIPAGFTAGPSSPTSSCNDIAWTYVSSQRIFPQLLVMYSGELL